MVPERFKDFISTPKPQWICIYSHYSNRAQMNSDGITNQVIRNGKIAEYGVAYFDI